MKKSSYPYVTLEGMLQYTEQGIKSYRSDLRSNKCKANPIRRKKVSRFLNIAIQEAMDLEEALILLED